MTELASVLDDAYTNFRAAVIQRLTANAIDQIPSDENDLRCRLRGRQQGRSQAAQICRLAVS
jgi:hypothetical protein